MSADRRFLLLFAFLLAGLVAFATMTERDGGHRIARAANEGTASQLTTPNVAPSWLPDASRTSVLRPLLSVTITKRHPDLALLFASRRSLLPGTQIVSYYGNPAAASMGVLGSGDIEDVVAQLEQRAEEFDRLNGPLGVVPALHLVYAVAQAQPTENGLYLQHATDGDVRRLLDVAREHEMLLFLDLQIGRSSVERELRGVLPYLRYPNVHLALDPEFAVASGEVPGIDLGSLRAEDVDHAQEALQQLVLDEALPPKLLIVHQFVDSMLPDGAALQRYPGVELILDMDGYGPAAIKRVKYEGYAGAADGTAYGGIKLFFDHDPDLMPAGDVLSLQPTPVLVIYQ
jgi:hypothetical protein